MADPFLNESWHGLAGHEEGLDFDEIKQKERERNYIAFEAIKRIGDHSPLALELVKDLEDSILRYIKSIDRLNVSRLEKSDKQTIEGDDRSRTAAHDALIGNLNILSRYCVKNKLDTSWRDIVGSHRNQIRDWALSVSAQIIKDKIERR